MVYPPMVGTSVKVMHAHIISQLIIEVENSKVETLRWKIITQDKVVEDFPSMEDEIEKVREEMALLKIK